MVDFWTGVGNSIGGFASGVGSVFAAPFDQGKSLIKAAQYNPWASTPAPKPKTPAPYKPKNNTTQDSSANDAYMAALEKQYQTALAALSVPQPRFVDYDISGSWAKAKEMATKAVSPIYKQKMTDFIKRQTQELGRQKADTTSGKSALDLALERLMGDTQVQRERTTEDTTTNIADINASQAYNTRGESLNFDAANRALIEGVGAGNMATSGLGQQQIQDNQMVRRDQSNETIRQSDNKIEAQNTLMNRTFQDLTTQETRSGEDTTQKKGKLDLDLERFIEDQSFEKDQKTKELELSKQVDIANKTTPLQGQLVDQWLASLSGQGYTAQEIANAASIYK